MPTFKATNSWGWVACCQAPLAEVKSSSRTSGFRQDAPSGFVVLRAPLSLWYRATFGVDVKRNLTCSKRIDLLTFLPFLIWPISSKGSYSLTFYHLLCLGPNWASEELVPNRQSIRGSGVRPHENPKPARPSRQHAALTQSSSAPLLQARSWESR